MPTGQLFAHQISLYLSSSLFSRRSNMHIQTTMRWWRKKLFSIFIRRISHEVGGLLRIFAYYWLRGMFSRFKLTTVLIRVRTFIVLLVVCVPRRHCFFWCCCKEGRGMGERDLMILERWTWGNDNAVVILRYKYPLGALSETGWSKTIVVALRSDSRFTSSLNVWGFAVLTVYHEHH